MLYGATGKQDTLKPEQVGRLGGLNFMLVIMLCFIHGDTVSNLVKLRFH